MHHSISWMLSFNLNSAGVHGLSWTHDVPYASLTISLCSFPCTFWGYEYQQEPTRNKRLHDVPYASLRRPWLFSCQLMRIIAASLSRPRNSLCYYALQHTVDCMLWLSFRCFFVATKIRQQKAENMRIDLWGFLIVCPMLFGIDQDFSKDLC